MKKIALMALTALLSTGALADETKQNGTTFKTTDDSPYAQLCLAALESREALQRRAQDLDINRRELNQVVCNEMSLVDFARAHQDETREHAIATVQ